MDRSGSITHAPFKKMFTEELWTQWVQEEGENYEVESQSSNKKRKYLKKGYLHFDPRFWFPERKNEIKALLSDPQKIVDRAFHPFVRVKVRTPRFKYDEEIDDYRLKTKVRPICFASHLDSLIYGFYAFGLTKKYQEYIKGGGVASAALSYRTDLDKRCNIQFAKEAFDVIEGKGECVAIALDITGYFDHIDHLILKEKWCKVLGVPQLPPDQYKIYRTLTKYSYVNKESILGHFNIDLRKIEKKPPTLLDIVEGEKDYIKFNLLRDRNLVVTNHYTERPRQFGIPQGSSLSAALSNVYLIDYDKFMVDLAEKGNFLYRRYCDDILLICNRTQAKKILKTASKEIEKYFLKIKSSKTEVILFTRNSKGNVRSFDLRGIEKDGVILSEENERLYYRNFSYLGFEYNGKNIYVRSSSLSRYFRKMKSRISMTVAMAYSDKGKGRKIFKQKLYHRYTHLGKRNFLKYIYNASKEKYSNSEGDIKEGLNSVAIRKQLSRHFDILIGELKLNNSQRISYKSRKGKLRSTKC